MKIIEDWIDSKLTSLVEGGDGYIILSNEDVTDLAQALGMQNPGNLYMKQAVKDYVYYLTDIHKDYFQQKLEEFGDEYAKQEQETNRVMQSCQ